MPELSQSFLTTALALAGVHVLGVLSPGADMAVVLRESFRGGRRAGVLAAAGVGAANLTHLGYVVGGLGLALARLPALLDGLRWAAALYLVYLAAGALRAQPPGPDGDGAELDTGRARRDSGHSPFLRGFLTCALNMKVTLFYLAVFAALMPVGETPGLWLAAAVAYLPLATFALFSGVAALAASPVVRRRYLAYGHWVDRAMGVVFLALAARLALTG